MQMTKFIVLASALTLFWLGCSEPDDGVPSSAFDYSAYDSLHTKVITGWFTMSVDSDSTITGEWHFTNVGEVREDVGPQLGDGTLAGNRSDNAIYLNLNPELADNNVSLVMSETNVGYAGVWTFSTYAGTTNWGAFTAMRHR